MLLATMVGNGAQLCAMVGVTLGLSLRYVIPHCEIFHEFISVRVVGFLIALQ